MNELVNKKIVEHLDYYKTGILLKDSDKLVITSIAEWRSLYLITLNNNQITLRIDKESLDYCLKDKKIIK